jgi:hypothetical protein
LSLKGSSNCRRTQFLRKRKPPRIRGFLKVRGGCSHFLTGVRKPPRRCKPQLQWWLRQRLTTFLTRTCLIYPPGLQTQKDVVFAATDVANRKGRPVIRPFWGSLGQVKQEPADHYARFAPAWRSGRRTLTSKFHWPYDTRTDHYAKLTIVPGPMA